MKARAAALSLLVFVLAGCFGSDPSPRSSSTLDVTFVDSDGNGVLEQGPGEPLRDRTELAPRSKPGKVLAVFAQLTDAHVTDEESPARVEMLDRLGTPFTSAFRPQEALTGQVLDAVVRSVNRLRPDGVVVTGDLVDNAQANELRQALGILRGGEVDPGSGGAAYEGVQAADNPDPFYYRPEVDPPAEPGLLREAGQSFVAAGLKIPWYPLVGNHDLLVQGNVPSTMRIERIAVGSRKVVRLDPSVREAVSGRRLSPTRLDRLLATGLPGDSIAVSPDPARRQLAPAELLSRLRAASGIGGRGPLLDYTFDLGADIRGIALDTVRRDGGAGGIIRPVQVRWLQQAVAEAGDRWIVVFSHDPLTRSGTEAALAVLDASPRVLAAIAGDSHRNSIAPRRTAAGGYWLVTTSSLVDYPQQARAFRLRDAEGDGVLLETWMLDHDDSSSRAARVSRELAFLDYQGGRPGRFTGSRRDRNARLYR